MAKLSNSVQSPFALTGQKLGKLNLKFGPGICKFWKIRNLHQSDQNNFKIEKKIGKLKILFFLIQNQTFINFQNN